MRRLRNLAKQSVSRTTWRSWMTANTGLIAAAIEITEGATQIRACSNKRTTERTTIELRAGRHQMNVYMSTLSHALVGSDGLALLTSQPMSEGRVARQHTPRHSELTTNPVAHLVGRPLSRLGAPVGGRGHCRQTSSTFASSSPSSASPISPSLLVSSPSPLILTFRAFCQENFTNKFHL